MSPRAHATLTACVVVGALVGVRAGRAAGDEADDSPAAITRRLAELIVEIRPTDSGLCKMRLEGDSERGRDVGFFALPLDPARCTRDGFRENGRVPVQVVGPIEDGTLLALLRYLAGLPEEIFQSYRVPWRPSPLETRRVEVRGWFTTGVTYEATVTSAPYHYSFTLSLDPETMQFVVEDIFQVVP